MAQMMKTRQKAFDLASEDEIGNVLQKSVDLLRALINSHADPEKLNLATNALERERLLVKESDNNGTARVRDFIYETSEKMESTMTWISKRENIRPKQQILNAACSATIPDENNNVTPTIKMECAVKTEVPDSDDEPFAVSEVGGARSPKKEEISDMELELCDISDNENEAQIKVDFSNVKSEKALEKGLVFKRKKSVYLSKEEYASLTADEKKKRKRTLGLANVMRSRAKQLASGPVDCHICGQTQTSKEALKYHVRTRHVNVGRYKCSACPKAFSSSSVLKRHELTHLAIDDPRRKNKDAFCKICNKLFKSNYIYKDHMRVHETDENAKKPHKCDLCEKAFTHIFNLNKHKRSHTNDETIIKPHKCNFCERRFALGWNLRDHERVHLPDDDPRKKGVECKICGKELSSMTTLRYHKKTHLGSERRRFNCDQCDQTFATSISLKFHKNNHTGDFPRKCEVCGKGYNTKQQIRGHMTNGTINPESEVDDSDAEVYMCNLCDKRYLKQCSLQSHKTKAHGRKSAKVAQTTALKEDGSSEEDEDDEDEDSEEDSDEETSDEEEGGRSVYKQIHMINNTTNS